ALLGRLPNVVTVNEPTALEPQRLVHGDATVLLQGFIAQTARRALKRGEVVTKADPKRPDRPTTDTFNRGAVDRPVPTEVDPSQPLAVGVKFATNFVDRLGELLDGWPELRALVIVRDPVSTIRSWRNGFGWQAGLDDPKQGFRFRLHERVPDSIADALERRAHLWRILVDEADAQAGRHPDRVRLIRYGDLLDYPEATIRRAARHLRTADPEAPIDVSDVRPQPRPHYDDFSPEEIAMLERVCGGVLEELTAAGAMISRPV